MNTRATNHPSEVTPSVQTFHNLAALHEEWSSADANVLICFNREKKNECIKCIYIGGQQNIYTCVVKCTLCTFHYTMCFEMHFAYDI